MRPSMPCPCSDACRVRQGTCKDLNFIEKTGKGNRQVPFPDSSYLKKSLTSLSFSVRQG